MDHIIEELTKMLKDERNREYFRWYVSTHNVVKPTKKRNQLSRLLPLHRIMFHVEQLQKRG